MVNAIKKILCISVCMLLMFALVCCAPSDGDESSGQYSCGDGTYEPDGVSFSGGTGRVQIVCDKIEIKDGEAFATIRFVKKSGSPASIDMLKVGEETYTESDGFTIPVQLNKNETIVARTTAMSQPHWIEYTVCIELEAAGGVAEGAGEKESAEGESSASVIPDEESGPPVIDGLEFDHAMELEDAEGFDIYYYSDGYKLIDVHGSARYLVIPEGKEAPEGLDESIYRLCQPLDNVYMAATGSMSFIEQLGVMDCVKMSSLKADDWMIDAPKEALNNGSMTFAGKYSEPDYEMMAKSGCDLAVESTMILHAPEVQEMIEDLGIPVFIDRLSYEPDAFGRIEWIKVYGVLFDKEEEAEAKFKEQKAVLDDLKDFENTGKTVAFFAVNMNGTITVRRSDDFIPNMIELAGGRYIFDNLSNPDSNSASVRLSMEEFYSRAVDADYIIYNGTIEDPIKSVDDLIAKDSLFSEFKAVKDGNVWTVDKSWYQSTATIGFLITDINHMLTGADSSNMVYLTKVE